MRFVYIQFGITEHGADPKLGAIVTDRSDHCKRQPVGLTHINFDVRNPYKWYDFLKKNGVEIVSEAEESGHGHAFFFVKDCDGNLIEIIALRYRYPLPRYVGWFASWLFRRGTYQKHCGRHKASLPL